MKDFWDWYKEEIMLVISLIVMLASLTITVGVLFGARYKYNCELDRRPSIHTALFIDDTSYAYNPETFCDKLKKKMEQE